ncbi:hypothetical protein B484DRAFT_392444 [Ochromonadaceae sp. CCMP2298]|nr:hypothetical protein B484DRAFT_392444 [Ochromonadaceae sp. CCMP2298]
MDVKSIIQQWYQELAEDAVDFEAQAQRVNVWDQQLRENQRTLEQAVDNVHRIMAGQADLKAACETIEAYQSELDRDLQSLDAGLEAELEAAQLSEPTEDDCEREGTYELAERLNLTLNQMEQNLKKVADDLHRSRGLGAGLVTGDAVEDSNNPIAKIVTVLNNHHESLAWLDEKSRQLHREIAVVKKELSSRNAI